MELPARTSEAEPRAAAPPEDERALVARARRDPEAFAALYRRHYPAIARYVRRRVGEEATAADLVAETFLVALEHLPRYRERGLPFRAWLYRLATSRVHRWLRRRALLHVLHLEGEPAARGGERGGESGGGSAALVRDALLSLPARYQGALTLHHLEGLSVEEVAATLGCRPGTIKARLSRGRERLRRRLAGHERELFS